ncbi:MAG: AGE family epimerase/isomerase [Anaerolineae bacterium]|nr:AGE family epimerase/isomerase [Anaerolineae bacterium]NUQ02819.1 AGE family epimerase/isomerase [Anaerolineae bacterium]
MNDLNFTFSDLIAGYVSHFNRTDRTVQLTTSDGRQYTGKLTDNVYARFSQNLGEGWPDATGRLGQLLVPGQLVYAYGIFYPEDTNKFEIKNFVFPGDGPSVYRHEEPDWWIKQVDQIANSYLHWQFNWPNEPIDYRNYRTFLHLAGTKRGDFLQETDTISRLVYGFASAFMMTGKDQYLEAAELGTEYLREHMRFFDMDEDLIYWYHGIQVSGAQEQKLLTSEFGDDYDSIPAYEQIYALAGPIQTYRATGDPRIRYDADKTIELFQKYFYDPVLGGYFSHIDPITLDPRAEMLGPNRARKNWNSVGDHAPAFLINLYLASGEKAHADMLEHCFDMITQHFQDYEHSSFVQEKFHEDWSHDYTYAWQKNGGVVGHNLKIAWNITRMTSLMAKPEYIDFAKRIAAIMPTVGMDTQRGGWYDVMERLRAPGEKFHRNVFHDRKAWWQQEQAILAYLIMYGVYRDEEYKKLARESAAYYNAFFPDTGDGGIYFNTLANGTPYLLGNERLKGSHSMSGYHSMELCYLGSVYQNLLISKVGMDFYFKPMVESFPDGLLRVAPDLLPAGSLRIASVEVDGKPYDQYDAAGLTVTLPKSDTRVKIKVRIEPVK